MNTFNFAAILLCCSTFCAYAASISPATKANPASVQDMTGEDYGTCKGEGYAAKE